MKKIILIYCLVLFSGSTFSQIRVDSLSYVLIPFYSIGLDEMSVKTSE